MNPSSEQPAILITGAARRVGAEIARNLHGAGASLLLHCRNSAGETEALAAELNATRPGSVACAAADLCDAAQLPRLVAITIEKFGRLDAQVNNASAFYATPLGSIDETVWQDLIGSNLKGPLFLCQAAAPHLKATRGAIVNITDIHAERPLKNYPLYCIAKAGLLGLTRALALEVASKGVTVNAVCPGFTDTDLVARSIEAITGKTGRTEEEARAALAASNPQGRLITPDEVAMTIVWLCGEGASGVNGAAV
ncbi:MAG: SDR family oxidoreductase, partial [Proteobacteria bacterium]|nr:SDR family oxidoreductase [Pseudomonadota bacterium]